MSDIQNLTLEAGVLQEINLKPQLDEYGCDTERHRLLPQHPFSPPFSSVLGLLDGL
jgi:hypothetical protein